MTKYIIKNCPACYNYDGKYGCEDNHDEQGRDVYCEKIDNCLLKRILELCNGIIEQRQEIDFDNIWGHSYSDSEISELNGQCKMARKILNLLEIEEVNE